MTFTAQSLVESPEYFPLKFEGANLVFVRMNRENYRDSIFTLPSRISTMDNQTWSVPFNQVAQIVENAKLENPAAKCIFQIAHCGSTLLSRALDINQQTLVIREPYVLRQFCASPLATSTEQADSRTAALRVIWKLLSRRFSKSESVIIKGNVPVNYSLGEISKITAEQPAVFLYSGFQDYLGSILKSEDRAQWVTHLITELGARILATLELSQKVSKEALGELSTAQATALLWASQAKSFESSLVQGTFNKSLDSEQWFKQPALVLQQCAKHLGSDISPTLAEQITQTDLFQKHAKIPDQDFSEDQRIIEQQKLRKRFYEDYVSTTAWLDTLGLSTEYQLKPHALELS